MTESTFALNMNIGSSFIGYLSERLSAIHEDYIPLATMVSHGEPYVNLSKID